MPVDEQNTSQTAAVAQKPKASARKRASKRSQARARGPSHRRRKPSEGAPRSLTMRRRTAWIRRALRTPRPPGRIASTMASTGASSTAPHEGKRARSRAKAR